MHKKSSEFSWGRSPSLFKQLFTHTHTLTGISLVEIESAYAWQLTQKHSSLPLAGRLLASAPGHLQNTAHPQLIWHWRWMDGSVWMGDGRFVGEEGVCWAMRDPVQSQPRAGGGPQTTTAAPILMAQTKRAPSAAPASGPPSPPQGKVHHSPERSPQSSPPLSSSSCPVLFVQPGRITWSRGRTWGPNHTGLNAFTCDPHS